MSLFFVLFLIFNSILDVYNYASVHNLSCSHALPQISPSASHLFLLSHSTDFWQFIIDSSFTTVRWWTFCGLLLCLHFMFNQAQITKCMADVPLYPDKNYVCIIKVLCLLTKLKRWLGKAQALPASLLCSWEMQQSKCTCQTEKTEKVQARVSSPCCATNQP